MTKKDYIVIARALRQAWNKAKPGVARLAIHDCVVNIAHELAWDNGRFDFDRFTQACEQGEIRERASCNPRDFDREIS